MIKMRVFFIGIFAVFAITNAFADIASTGYVANKYVGDGTVVTVENGSGAQANNKIISVATATATTAGVAALGTIPSGSDKKGTATIWIE